ncbi:unnamed protein product [Closterium sp. NIES-64]|nr:unnamed protein product [Closterium sp. NIES-64]
MPADCYGKSLTTTSLRGSLTIPSIVSASSPVTSVVSPCLPLSIQKPSLPPSTPPAIPPTIHPSTIPPTIPPLPPRLPPSHNPRDFARNMFRGTIPSFFATLTKLDVLGFATNALSGIVPPTLGNLLLLTALEFNESGTVCSGARQPCVVWQTPSIPLPISPCPSLPRLLRLNESGMVCPGAGQPCVVYQTPSSHFCINCPDFCSSCSNSSAPSSGSPAASPSPPPPANSTPPLPPTDTSSSSSSSALPLGAIIGIAVGGVLVFVLLVIGLFLLWKRRSPQAREPSSLPTGVGESSVPTQSLMCQRYPLEVVVKAMDNWAEANHIGSGGHGEVEEMASKNHLHLVRLLGYCVDIDRATDHHEQIVIYEFCPNGDLEKYLTRGSKKGKLTLQQRMDVLVGVARGLEYLHQFDIVHRDIKPANVLLDANMQAKISDFGLVRMTEGTTVNPTRVVGTPGYVDPAYSRTNKATPMADIYSFGVMMLRIILTKPVVIQENGGINIRDWVDKLVQADDIEALKDPNLDSIPDELLLKHVPNPPPPCAQPTSSMCPTHLHHVPNPPPPCAQPTCTMCPTHLHHVPNPPAPCAQPTSTMCPTHLHHVPNPPPP